MTSNFDNGKYTKFEMNTFEMNLNKKVIVPQFSAKVYLMFLPEISTCSLFLVYKEIVTTYSKP
jgi:hypothetical protein